MEAAVLRDFVFLRKPKIMGLKTTFFRGLAKLNRTILPNYTKRGLDLEHASKFQLAIIGWKAWVTKHAGNSNQKLLKNE